jgi:hypothetical protein
VDLDDWVDGISSLMKFGSINQMDWLTILFSNY